MPYLSRLTQRRQAIEKHLEYDELLMRDPTLESSARVYDEETALRKMMEGHGNSLSEDSARVLMQRGTRRHGQGLVFTRDIRQKLPSLDPAPTEEVMLRFVARIRCDLLVIRAKQGAYPVPGSVRQKYYSLYERNCRIFRDVLLDGTHHLHMNSPHTVGPVINAFLVESLQAQSGFSSSL